MINGSVQSLPSDSMQKLTLSRTIDEMKSKFKIWVTDLFLFSRHSSNFQHTSPHI